MRIGLFVKRSDQALSIARTIHDHLRKKGLEIILNEENAKVLGMEPYPGVPDMMIAVGGDGSLLHAETHHPGVPLVCIRVGSLNFLSDIEVEEDSDKRLMVVNEGVTLQELVNGLNALGIGPRDMITILQAIKAAGAYLLYLPAYSPDLNPIEQAFAKLKALLRKIAARTVEELWQAIADCLDQFTPQECRNYFLNAGYGSYQP